jgi:hypothetical protein
MLDPTRHVTKKFLPLCVFGEGPTKNVLSKNVLSKNVLIQLTMFNKDRQKAKSTLKKLKRAKVGCLRPCLDF